MSKTIGFILITVTLIAGYVVYDLHQAKRMAADACERAIPGTTLDEFLTMFPQKDYKAIRSSDTIIIVPRSGMGRSHCTVTHDGQKIISASIGFID